LFGELKMKVLLGVIGSKKTGHDWFANENSSRGFRFALVCMGERTFLMELCNPFFFTLTGEDSSQLAAECMVFIFSSLSNGSSIQTYIIQSIKKVHLAFIITKNKMFLISQLY
jgi:hypothetical protein